MSTPFTSSTCLSGRRRRSSWSAVTNVGVMAGTYWRSRIMVRASRAPSRLPRSAAPVIGEDVVSRLHDRVAPQSTLGVVPLRRHVGCGAAREGAGRRAIVERGPSPPTAVGEPLAVLHHEVDVMLRARHRRGGERLQLLRAPMDLRHLGPVGERLAVPGHAGLVGFDHHGIREDRSKQGSVLTDGDNLPGLVSPELGEREPTRHLQGALVLGGHGAARGTHERRYDSDRPHALAFHHQLLLCQAWRPGYSSRTPADDTPAAALCQRWIPGLAPGVSRALLPL